jgi:hypothetical protein
MPEAANDEAVTRSREERDVRAPAWRGKDLAINEESHAAWM